MSPPCGEPLDASRFPTKLSKKASQQQPEEKENIFSTKKKLSGTAAARLALTSSVSSSVVFYPLGTWAPPLKMLSKSWAFPKDLGDVIWKMSSSHPRCSDRAWGFLLSSQLERNLIGYSVLRSTGEKKKKSASDRSLARLTSKISDLTSQWSDCVVRS